MCICVCDMDMCVCVRSTVERGNRIREERKHFVKNWRAKSGRKSGQFLAELLWSFEKKNYFLSGQESGQIPAGFWRVTVGHEFWPAVSFLLILLFGPKYLHLFLSSVVCLWEKRENSYFRTSIFIQILRFHRWILKPLRTSAS